MGSYHEVATDVDPQDAVKVEIGYHDEWDRLRISLDGFDKAGWEYAAAEAWIRDREEARKLGEFLLEWASRQT